MAEPKKVIVVTVLGGCVSAVEGIPDDVDVHVQDYDAEFMDPEKIRVDDDGDEYTLTIW